MVPVLTIELLAGENVRAMAMVAGVVVMMGAAGTAMADSDSLLTLGLGSSVGVAHVKPVTGGTENSVVSEMNVRLRLLTVLGADFNYNVAGENSVGHGESYTANVRFSALLYVVPTSVASLYLSAGAGASDFSTLTDSGVSEKSYHGGGGLEIYAGDHMSLTTEFLMLVPEVSKIVVSQQPLRVDESGHLSMPPSQGPSISDYISAENFQVTFGLKYYF